MHLDCSIAHLGYCQGDILSKNKQKTIADALSAFDLIKSELDDHIKMLELKHISEDN